MCLSQHSQSAALSARRLKNNVRRRRWMPEIQQVREKSGAGRRLFANGPGFTKQSKH
jgi:hypothetical protein